MQRLTATPNPVSLLGGEFTEVTVTIEVSDDFNGFSEGYLYLTEDASGNEYNSQLFDSSHLVSGDSKFGTYEVTFELYPDDFSPEEGGYQAGTYLFTADIYEETSGNVRYYGNGDDPFPIPGSEFLTIGGGPSGAAPFLTGISSISPGRVDVSSGDQTITVEFGVNSNNIGFSCGDVSLYNANGNFVQSIFFSTAMTAFQETTSAGPTRSPFRFMRIAPPGHGMRFSSLATTRTTRAITHSILISQIPEKSTSRW